MNSHCFHPCGVLVMAPLLLLLSSCGFSPPTAIPDPRGREIIAALMANDVFDTERESFRAEYRVLFRERPLRDDHLLRTFNQRAFNRARDPDEPLSEEIMERLRRESADAMSYHRLIRYHRAGNWKRLDMIELPLDREGIEETPHWNRSTSILVYEGTPPWNLHVDHRSGVITFDAPESRDAYLPEPNLELLLRTEYISHHVQSPATGRALPTNHYVPHQVAEMPNHATIEYVFNLERAFHHNFNRLTSWERMRYHAGLLGREALIPDREGLNRRVQIALDEPVRILEIQSGVEFQTNVGRTVFSEYRYVEAIAKHAPHRVESELTFTDGAMRRDLVELLHVETSQVGRDDYVDVLLNVFNRGYTAVRPLDSTIPRRFGERDLVSQEEVAQAMAAR